MNNHAAMLIIACILLGGCESIQTRVTGTGNFAPLARVVAKGAVAVDEVTCRKMTNERRTATITAQEVNGRRRETVAVEHQCSK